MGLHLGHDIAAGASQIARVLFYVSLTFFLVLLVAGWFLYRKVTSVARLRFARP